MGGLDISILVSSAQHMLKLLKAAVLGSSAIFDQEKLWIADCLRWRQELCLVLEVFAVGYPRRVRFFIFDTFDHLVQIEAHGQFLGALTICIDYKKVTLLILSPKTALFQVDGVDTGSSLEWHPKYLKEVVVVFLAEFKLFTDIIKVSSFICGYQDDFTVLADLDHREIVASNQVNKRAARTVNPWQILLLEIGGDDCAIR